jgi:hypothetical protein
MILPKDDFALSSSGKMIDGQNHQELTPLVTRPDSHPPGLTRQY